jgi:hypothetical protein
MTPQEAAYCIGIAWLETYRGQPDRVPDPNTLAEQCEEWKLAEYDFDLVRSCGVVAEAVAVIQGWRKQ